MLHPPRVILIALDAAEPSILRRWAAAGKLPALQSIIDAGATADLTSAAIEFPDEVWPSVYTSVNAAKLGKYFYIQPKAKSEELEMVDDRPKGKQFWLTLSDAGRRCAVLDLPKIALGPYVNGVQIANWGAHATRCDTASHPPDLIGDVRRTIGDYPLPSCDNHGRSAAAMKRLRTKMIEGVQRRGELFREMLQKDDWDLFFCAFAETHCAGHQFWHCVDPTHPFFPEAQREGLGTVLEDVYRAIDAEIAGLLAFAGPETHVIVFSGHGMTGQYHGRDMLPHLLEMWGLDGPRNIEPDPANEKDVTVKRGLVQALKETVPIQLQYVVKSLLPKAIEDAIICRVMGSKKLDPEARINYVPNNDLNPAFRVNLKGRDPHGKVDPADYEALCDWLEQRLLELVNVKTGERAVRHVTRLKDTHSGPYLELLPDVCAMWKSDAWIGELHSPGYGTVRADHHDLRTGGHNTKGFFAMNTPGAEADLDSLEPNAKDIAPTVLRLLGVETPDEYEGRSLVKAARPVSAA